MKFKPDPGNEKDKPYYDDLAIMPVEEALTGTGRVPHNRMMERHSSDSPGGRIAKMRGCTCPVIHDERGNTVLLVDGHRMMVYRSGCPVHAPNKVDPKKFRQAMKTEFKGKPGLYRINMETGLPEPLIIRKDPGKKDD